MNVISGSSFCFCTYYDYFVSVIILIDSFSSDILSKLLMNLRVFLNIKLSSLSRTSYFLICSYFFKNYPTLSSQNSDVIFLSKKVLVYLSKFLIFFNVSSPFEKRDFLILIFFCLNEESDLS